MTKQAKPRLRILLGSGIAIGPGKADLLEAIARTGSISAAAREMGMSYRRAWTLVEVMSRSFRGPLVETLTGGSGDGGAQVTELGVSPGITTNPDSNCVPACAGTQKRGNVKSKTIP